MLLAIALIALARISWKHMLMLAWMPVVLVVLAVIFLRGPLRPLPASMRLLYEDESAYNYIQVVRFNQANLLMLNEGQAIHSIYYPEAPDFIETGGQWDFFLAAPFFNAPPIQPADVRSMAQVGLAGGTIAKQYTAVFGPIPIDGIEIDPDIIRIGRTYFGMNEPNLNVIVQDGRYALANSPRTYDVIGIDAYRMPYVPWHLTTVEFFQEARDHLTERGVVVINAGRTVNDRRVVDAFAVTLLQVFASVHVIDVPYSCNSVMFATVQPTVPENLLANLERLQATAHPFLSRVLALSYKQLRPTPQEGMLFTDDKAAVELLTDSILVNFALSGDTALPCQ
jgi:spermidine synthase